MATKSVFSLDRWKSRLKSAWSYDPKDRAYVIVLIGLILTMLAFYYLSMSADDYETIMMARLTIYATLILLVAAVLNAFFGIEDWITPEEEEEVEVSETDELFETETELSFNLSFIMLARKTGAIVAYFLGVYYIGFYTFSTAFTFVYVALNTDETGRMRWIRSALVAIFVVSLLWIIFDFFLDMIQIYRLGPLP